MDLEVRNGVVFGYDYRLLAVDGNAFSLPCLAWAQPYLLPTIPVLSCVDSCFTVHSERLDLDILLGCVGCVARQFGWLCDGFVR